MIHSITGSVVKYSERHILLALSEQGMVVKAQVSGSATAFWQRTVPPDTTNSVSITVYTHLMIRDDTFMLYGFYSELEQQLFLLLLKVNGIGPKMALTILSAVDAGELNNIISAGDEVTLGSFKGISQKNAQKIILTLKGSISTLNIDAQDDDLTVALLSMGYHRTAITSVLQQTKSELKPSDYPTTHHYEEAVLQLAIKRLS